MITNSVKVRKHLGKITIEPILKDGKNEFISWKEAQDKHEAKHQYVDAGLFDSIGFLVPDKNRAGVYHFTPSRSGKASATWLVSYVDPSTKSTVVLEQILSITVEDDSGQCLCTIGMTH